MLSLLLLPNHIYMKKYFYSRLLSIYKIHIVGGAIETSELIFASYSFASE